MKKRFQIFSYPEVFKILKKRERFLNSSKRKTPSFFQLKISAQKIFFLTSSKSFNFFWIVFLIMFLIGVSSTLPLVFLKMKYYFSQIFLPSKEIASQIKNNSDNSSFNSSNSSSSENKQKESNFNQKVLFSGISEKEIQSGTILYIPRIDVKATIVEMPERGGIPSEKEVQSYLKKGVVLYPYTARPGEIGNVVIFGHSSRYLWETGRYKYVFTLLEETKIGDEVYIFWKGKTYVYRIYEKKVIEPTQTEIMYSDNRSILTLATCTPPYKRLMVRAVQEYPSPSQNVLANHPLLPNIK